MRSSPFVTPRFSVHFSVPAACTHLAKLSPQSPCGWVQWPPLRTFITLGLLAVAPSSFWSTLGFHVHTPSPYLSAWSSVASFSGCLLTRHPCLQEPPPWLQGSHQLPAVTPELQPARQPSAGPLMWRSYPHHPLSLSTRDPSSPSLSLQVCPFHFLVSDSHTRNLGVPPALCPLSSGSTQCPALRNIQLIFI